MNINKQPALFEELEFFSDDTLFTVHQISQLVQVSEETVRRWIRSKRLQIYAPTGRYKVRCVDLKCFLKRWYHEKIKKAETF